MSYVRGGGTKLLGRASYGPASDTVKSVVSTTPTAFDTTNLRVTFTAPASGKVLVRTRANRDAAPTTTCAHGHGLLNGSTLVAGNPIGGKGGGAHYMERTYLVDGLTPGASISLDWCGWKANAVAGGPSLTAALSTIESYGAATMEVYEVRT